MSRKGDGIEMKLKAPFPYFGAKSTVAHLIWERFGNPMRYIEPFFGSGAVLLLRQNWNNGMDEIVNDADSHICNVWRSLKFSPDVVAEWADWPVNHDCLRARKKALIENEGRLHQGCANDPEWHDAKMAGYWIWAASCWIGSGLTIPNSIPHISNSGGGVHAKGKIPHISNSTGIHAKGQIPHIKEWFDKLSERLRNVKVVVGDWTQVCGGNWQTKLGVCGIFFDPPYSAEAERDGDLYAKENLHVAHDVREWAAIRGASAKYRICIAGYEGEGHEALEKIGWDYVCWKAIGGYANQGDRGGKENRHRERLWFSPHCLKPGLF